MLGNGVQIGLESSLPLCYELPVHVSYQLFRWKRETDAANLEKKREKPFILLCSLFSYLHFKYFPFSTLSRFLTVLLHVDWKSEAEGRSGSERDPERKWADKTSAENLLTSCYPGMMWPDHKTSQMTTGVIWHKPQSHIFSSRVQCSSTSFSFTEDQYDVFHWDNLNTNWL